MDLVTLKAQAYDILAQIEYLQKKLQETNQAIAAQMEKDNEGESKPPTS
jgi:N-acetylglutamate synthase/N-acetylornithine aminotransferase